ncbi:Long-chain-fatty-acid--CoA ligase [Winogradskyella psychrotolerans RS-3]|uniref:Long-chain-fatty-acid--CoA ligase n=1 Tax=Winogradskyella psychrotolerans RS-3 TaxID=641526 RepID=S7VXE6_9FLAO|nr:thioesterase domain-containing protein [Winogradskyella psychrotolerans]EPR74092.1 Long-chain-fatty-acid--CoA ligase [Winogradskyella psychrotolerans RS-3]
MKTSEEYNLLKASDIPYCDDEVTFYSLVPLQPKGHKAPLFIVHGADYNVSKFNNLAKNLDADQPVYALQARGIKGDVRPHETVEEMASSYISEIKYINQEKPFALAGFSFGGIIAFEMVKQLKDSEINVKGLFLFDSYVYPTYYCSDPSKKKVVSILYNIGQLSFMGLNMFSSIANFKRRVYLLKLKFQGLLLKLKYGREQQYQLQFSRSSKIDELHSLAYIRYHIIPQNIRVNLFWSSKKLYFTHDYNYLGWKNISLQGINKHILPGNHSEMFLSPVVEEFGKKLQILLDNED